MAASNPLNQTSTLSELLREHSLAEALAYVDQNLRRKPDLSGHLLRLDLLCLLGDWERAAKQGETCTRFDTSCLPLMALIHALTECEKQRERVFLGTENPALLEAVPAWLPLQLQALRAQAESPDKADDLRETALSQAPESTGTSVSVSGESRFAWITDSDTRLGPVVEIFTQDEYLWLPFAALEELELAEPTALRDFIWLPISFVAEGRRRHGFLPGRYPDSVSAGDTFALGRETRWQDVGKTGVFGFGQKVWCTDMGDLPLYELRKLSMVNGDPA